MAEQHTREAAVDHAEDWVASGEFERELANAVACATESQVPGNAAVLTLYLSDHIAPRLAALGFACEIHDNPVHGAPPLLTAERFESATAPTLLGYGHGDVVRGQHAQWSNGRDPFVLRREGGRLYGRGSADNKAQHLINFAALEAVLRTRGRLGFNARFVVEMGEEVGSPGLSEFFTDNPQLLDADAFIASDGPRLQPDVPTVFLGSRGSVNFELSVSLRDAAHHSGNWGGLLRDPAIVLSNAIASICDEQGRILVEGWRRDSLTDSVRAALAGLPVAMDEGPSIDPDWGEPGLSAAERVLGWNSFAVLSLHSGVPEAPQNAIAPSATAVCQLRIVVGTLAHEVVPALREHLDGLGFHHVQVSEVSKPPFEATRVDPTNPWVDFAQKSIEQTTGKAVHILPNLGGSLPNAIFASLPTIWIPHSYRGCSQHAPDEHVLEDISRESVRLMAGLYYDVGSGGAPPKR